MPRYQIIDEPRPGFLSRLAVRPFWPLLAAMLAGSWLGLPWLVFNSFAVGSSRSWRLVLVAIAGLLGAVVIAITLLGAVSTGVLVDTTDIRLGQLVLLVWKIAIAYVLFSMQASDVALFEYYRGTVRNGLVVVVAAYFLGDRLLAGLPRVARLVLQ